MVTKNKETVVKCTQCGLLQVAGNYQHFKTFFPKPKPALILSYLNIYIVYSESTFYQDGFLAKTFP